jgi:hypothetical protein
MMSTMKWRQVLGIAMVACFMLLNRVVVAFTVPGGSRLSYPRHAPLQRFGIKGFHQNVFHACTTSNNNNHISACKASDKDSISVDISSSGSPERAAESGVTHLQSVGDTPTSTGEISKLRALLRKVFIPSTEISPDYYKFVRYRLIVRYVSWIEVIMHS